MMKRLLLYFFSLVPIFAYSQSTDFYRTFPSGSFTSGALVHLPSDYYSRTDSLQAIVFFTGSGQVGIDTSKIDDYGPHARLRGGWDGGEQLALGKYYAIYISVQLPSAFKVAPDLDVLRQNILAAYRIKTISFTGLSAGGWEAGMYVAYKASPGSTYYQTKVKSIAIFSAVEPSDAQGSTPVYPDRFTDFALAGGKAFVTVQSGDFIVDESAIVNTMNAAVAGSATYETTTNGAGTHCCWDYEYGSATRTPRTHVINGVTENIYQFMLRSGGDTSIFSSNGQFNFTLASTQRTSAGVYKNDSTLVRTLWADSTFPAGTYTRYWDGKDDNGNIIPSPDPTYVIRVLSNNVVYAWDGVIGNTSSSKTGQGVHRGTYTSMVGMAITGTTAYFSQGYSEGYPSEAKFSTSAPQVRLNPFSGNATMNSELLTTDGINVYWAGYDGVAQGTSFIHTSKVSDDTQFSFGANGSSYAVTYGRTYSSVIDKVTGNIQGHATGLAVSGSFLFVAHKGLNQLHVFNKTTGALVQSLAVTKPDRLAIDGSNLWMVTDSNVVSKYPINVDGTLSAATLTLSGVNTAGAIAVKPGTIAVIDAGLQQIVRFYNTSTGVQGTSLGTVGGYLNNPTVNNNKFMFDGYVLSGKSYLAYAPDGSLWVGDGGNYRNQHFSASNTFIETIMSMGATYTIGVDPNNINRVFGNYLEFNVDYTQPLSSTTGWSLVKNWGYIAGALNGTLYKLINIVTLSNGRTYCFNYYQGAGELSPTGFRFIAGSTVNPNGGILICKDGSLQKTTGNQISGSNLVVTRYPLTGFDGSNNPIWSSTGTVFATTPTNNDSLPNTTPVTDALTYHNKILFYTTTIKYLGDITKPQRGWHLGAINKAGTTWRWKTMNATYTNYQGDFPNADRFDIGNGVNDYAGSQVNAIDSNVITGYHGEFWKQGETNWYNHILDDGLAVGQFGTDGAHSSPFSDSGNAGNALTIALIRQSPTTLYLYHGDESQHSGIHRWKISNVNSISESYQTIPFPSAYVAPVVVGYVDLHAGLPFNSTLATQNGWSKTGSTVQYYSNRKKYINDGSPDVLYADVPPYTTTTGTAAVQRDLGTNNVIKSWKITTTINFSGTLTIGNGNKVYVEVLDAGAKVLARFYWNSGYAPFPTPFFNLFGNTAQITNDVQAGPNEVLSAQPLTIQCVNGLITFTYGTFAPVSAAIFDGTGNWRTPKTFRAFTTFASPSSGAQVGFVGSRLYLDPVGSVSYYVSTSGDDSRTALQAQNPATPWMTINKINISQAFFNPGDSILFKRGEVFFGTLSTGKSGMKILPIVYSSYGTGALPILSGMAVVTGWTLVSTGVYESAANPAFTGVKIVTLNGKPQAMGRFPNTGYLAYESHTSTTSITDNQLTGSPNWTGAEIAFKVNRYTLEHRPINSHAGTVLNYSGGTNTPVDNSGYFIENDIRTLDQVGEWFYNTSTKKIDMYFGPSGPGGNTVKANYLDTIISFHQANYLVLNNLAVEYGGARAINLYYVNGIEIKNVTINNSGWDAIFAAFCDSSSIHDNTITNSGNSGMNFANSCDYLSVINNTIRLSGIMPGMGNNAVNSYNGMTSALGSYNTIQNNIIDSSGYAGIRFTGNYNTIKNNFISNTCFIKDDGGSIYTGNGSDSTAVMAGNKILDNVVINAIGSPLGTSNLLSKMANGIYIDDNSSFFTITGNTSANNFGSGILLHNSKNIFVRGNTLFNNAIQLNINHDHDTSSGGKTYSRARNDTVRSNIMVSALTNQFPIEIRSISNDFQQYGLIDSNTYAKILINNLIHRVATAVGINDSLSLAGWQAAYNYDLHGTKTAIPTTFDSLRFEYNGTQVIKNVTLGSPYKDMKGVSYSGTISMAPYTSLVLALVSGTHSTMHYIGSGSGDIYFVNDGSVIGHDTMCVAAGTYGQISFSGLQGTVTDSIVIINCGGQVRVTNDSLYGFRVVNSQYVKFTGTGSSSFVYGFYAVQPNLLSHGGAGMNFKDSTTHYQIDHYAAYNLENGFLCKIDPYNDAPGTYSTGWTIAGVTIQDCSVIRTRGEGYYIINTASTVTVNIAGVPTVVEPVKATNMKVLRCISDSTGWDGIQVAASDGLVIENNSVSNYGMINMGSQQGGILVGGKCQNVIVRNNKVEKGTGNGLQVFGAGTNITISNNLLISTGIDGTLLGQHGIFVDDRPVSGYYTGLGPTIINNDVINSGNAAIGIFNSFGTMAGSKVYGNLLIQPQGKYLDVQGGAVVDTINNIKLVSTASALFAGVGDYHLQYNSPARAKVFVSTATYNTQMDYDNVVRGYPYAAGAYEFVGIVISPQIFIKFHRRKFFIQRY